jgi:hypothetical protein
MSLLSVWRLLPHEELPLLVRGSERGIGSDVLKTKHDRRVKCRCED